MTRNQVNRINTIQAIKDSFMELYQVHGIDKVRVADICAHAKVSKSNFYNYFDDKYEILESIEAEMLQGVTEINSIEHCEFELSQWPVFLPELYNVWKNHPDPSQNVHYDLSVEQIGDYKWKYINDNTKPAVEL